MLRRHSLLSVFFKALMAGLIAFSALWPALDLVEMQQETGLALAYIVAFSVLFSAADLLKPVLRFPGKVLLMGLVLLFPKPVFKPVLECVSAIVQGGSFFQVLLLYLDALLPLVVLMICLYGLLLTESEAAYSAPLVLALLMMIWFAGARQNIIHYVPGAVTVPLLFAYNRPMALVRLNVGTDHDRKRLLKSLPVVMVFIFLALALTPGQKTTVPAMEKKAEEIRQFVNDYFFFTDSREAFSLRNEGWEPMEDGGLGGTPAASTDPALEVKGSGRIYLRGTISDYYDGRRWSDTLSNRRYGYNSMRFVELRNVLMDRNLPASDAFAEKKADVHLLKDGTSTLFTPQRLRELVPGAGMVVYFNAGSELFITRNLRPGDGYQVQYEDYVAGRELKALSAKLSMQTDRRYAEIQAQYAELPGHLTPDGIVAELARKMSDGAQTPYEKAEAIWNGLRKGYEYTLSVPNPPKDRDFVAHFLFESKKGYCTYFASAMTVLCRSINLPARYVEGYLAELPEQGGTTTLTGRNAHAWTEVYIPSVGWVVFDAAVVPNESSSSQDPPGAGEKPSPSPSPSPTPQLPSPSPESGEGGENQEPTPSPVPDSAESPLPSESPSDEPDQSKPNGSAWWLLLLLLFALAAWRVYATNPEQRVKKAKSPTQAAKIWWAAVVYAYSAKGTPPLASETMQDYALRIAPSEIALQQLAEAMGAVQYGNRLLPKETALLAKQQYLALVRALTPVQKVWMVVIRCRPTQSLRVMLFFAGHKVLAGAKQVVASIPVPSIGSGRKTERKRKKRR